MTTLTACLLIYSKFFICDQKEQDVPGCPYQLEPVVLFPFDTIPEKMFFDVALLISTKSTGQLL